MQSSRQRRYFFDARAILTRNDNGTMEGITTKIFDSPFALKYTEPQVACSILDWSSVEYSVMYKNKEQW